MELLIAVLIALGSITSSADFTDANQADIQKAEYIINNGNYDQRDGGVIIEPDIDG